MRENWFYLLVAILLFSVGCDNPSPRRSYKGVTNTDSPSNNPPLLNGEGVGSTTPTTPTIPTTDLPLNVPPEIKHCKWSSDGITGYSSTSSHFGPYTFCQSKDNKANVFIQVRNPILDAQLCIIPTASSGNTSIYLGQPRCIMANDPKQIYKIDLIKDRTNYGTYEINGAMIMKDKSYFYPSPFYQYVLSPDAYLFCSQFLDQYADSSYCVAFKSVGEYVYHQF